MKRLLAVSVMVLPLALSACGTSYDAYRSKDRHSYDDDGDYSTGSEGSGDGRSHARVRPGWSVTESADYQGGYGPGSYGGRSSTYIRPNDDGDVIIGGESYRR